MRNPMWGYNEFDKMMHLKFFNILSENDALECREIFVKPILQCEIEMCISLVRFHLGTKTEKNENVVRFIFDFMSNKNKVEFWARMSDEENLRTITLEELVEFKDEISKVRMILKKTGAPSQNSFGRKFLIACGLGSELRANATGFA